MLRRIFIAAGLFLLLGSFASAKVIKLNYVGTFGIFGTVGGIKNTLTQNKKTYKIETTVIVEGLAKVLMRNPTEHYVSKGHMENGLMVSDSYKMVSSKKDKKVTKEYHIDHKKKYVTKRYRKWRKGKLVEDRIEKLKFYAKDDLLTLYFNLGAAVKKKGKKYLFHAVGLEKQDGKVEITAPGDEALGPYVKELGLGAMLYAKALIHQKNFRKKQGDILLAVAKDGFISKSVIKDILFYGDAELTRIK
ncbi:MAG: hypothetical protein HKP62_00010 [Sulfurovum sp.]|nr:hypothetical protein [Sulfurovum sp.]NNJ44382.1 hypothetical protein [Sulfurovum sp.]